MKLRNKDTRWMTGLAMMTAVLLLLSISLGILCLSLIGKLA